MYFYTNWLPIMTPKNAENTPVLRGIHAKYVRLEKRLDCLTTKNKNNAVPKKLSEPYSFLDQTMSMCRSMKL